MLYLGVYAEGTGLVSFENVKVPAKNLLGQPGMGMMITMHNFNMERVGICTLALVIINLYSTLTPGGFEFWKGKYANKYHCLDNDVLADGLWGIFKYLGLIERVKSYESVCL
jgi:hypothetical protein